jgi:putative OPT family oligopeptide transporter
VAAIMIGAVVCCAAAVGGDNLQDLKAGYIVGATPWKQQLMLGIGAFSCALIMAPVLNLLAEAYGIGDPTRTSRFAAGAAGHADGLGGARAVRRQAAVEHDRPARVIGAVIIAIDGWLKSRNSTFRVPVLAAAIGIYLPLELMVPIFLGGLLAHFVEKRHGIVGTHDEARATACIAPARCSPPA